jgi:hypothetical protein
MAKKGKFKIPKKVLGFKLSKGSRKDLTKLLRMLMHPETPGLAKAALGALGAMLAERMTAHDEVLTPDDPPSRPQRAPAAAAH